MFQNNSRIENLAGVRFYEQDIIYDDHIYTGDIEIVMQADYVSPGFGIALLNNEGLSLQEQKEVFLFRTGFRESSVIYKYNYEQKNIKRSSTVFEPPYNDIYFTFSKQGKRIKLSCSAVEDALIEYTLPNNNWDKFSFGIYSNAGNVVKSINIASSIPKNWTVNMHNTNGGYIRFGKSEFELIGCKNSAEVEQNKINLKKGKYFLKYETEPNKENDIRPYVFLSGDDRLENQKKNILVDKTFFLLEEDAAVNIKFSGKNGLIKNINLCENINDHYVATKDGNSKVNGSYIEIDLEDVETIFLTGMISQIPPLTEITEEFERPYVIKHNDEIIQAKELGIELNKFYHYIYKKDSAKLIVEEKDNPSNSMEYSFYKNAKKITILNNMDCLVVSFKIKKANKEELIDFIKENINNEYVPKDVTSPIIVIDNENMPLDLSSSYRFVNTSVDNEPSKKYIFTNVERELFEADTFIKLTNKPSRELNKIKVYGIYKNSGANIDRFYENTKVGIDDLLSYTPHHILLDNNKISHINANLGEIYLDDLDAFEAIVVDYEKRNSYCINYIPELLMYEVSIANEQQPVTLLYDTPIKKNGVSELESYKQLKTAESILMKPVNKQYIVLRKEWTN